MLQVRSKSTSPASPEEGNSTAPVPAIADPVQPPNSSGLPTVSQSLFISETFSSRQGEGKLTGQESFFIRTSGCNLRCWFCDTPYASWQPTGQRQSIESLVQDAQAVFTDQPASHRHVVLTGGEPLLGAAIEPLCHLFQQAGFHVTLETAGTIQRELPCDLLSLSPKLASSAPDAKQHPRWHQLHEQRRMPLNTMRYLIETAKDHQLKFVVSDRSQFDEIQSLVEQLEVHPSNVFIMPQGVSIDDLDAALPWLQPWTEQVGYHYCDRMQIRWYGNRRGT